MSQERYIDSILHRLRMSNCKSIKTPAEKGLQLTEATDDEHQKVHSFPYRSAVGSLICLMVGTRPDISWIVSKLSQFLEKPGITHVNAIKHLMKYISKERSHTNLCSPRLMKSSLDTLMQTGEVIQLIDDLQLDMFSHLEVHQSVEKRKSSQQLLSPHAKRSIWRLLKRLKKHSIFEVCYDHLEYSSQKSLQYTQTTKELSLYRRNQRSVTTDRNISIYVSILYVNSLQ